MNCSFCQAELKIFAYVVLPLINSNACMLCWSNVEEQYDNTVNNYVRGNNA